MKKKWLAVLTVVVLTAAAFAADFPSYLKVRGTTVTGYTDSLPADLVIPEGITAIGYGAFNDCESLKSVTIPSGVKEIQDSAFCKCESLVSVTIPNSVTAIGDYAFICCTSLASVTIPNSVMAIGERAFVGCTSLVSVTIPNSVTAIGKEVFAYCDSLRKVHFVGIAEQFRSISGIGYIALQSGTVIYCTDDELVVK